MRLYKNKWFNRWAKGEGLTDRDLCSAVRQMEEGLIDAILGGNLVKKRVAAAGRGKSGSFRTIIAYKAGDRAFFLYGFAKNQRDNIDDKEREALKKIAKELFGYDARTLNEAVKGKALVEVKCDE